MADKTVTLPEQDWQILMAALYEVPAKISLQVIVRLQQALAESPAELHVVPKEASSDGR